MTHPVPLSTPPAEKFDLNHIHLAGEIRRLWSAGPDVLARLAVPGEPDQPENFLTLRFPRGQAAGAPVTLLKGDRLTVQGYLQDAPYVETGQQFAARARKPELLAAVPGLAEISSPRMATYVAITGLQPHAGPPANEALIEGIVSRVWERGSQRFARLAIYDEFTSIDPANPARDGRPWRQAHYVSVHFVDGQVNGRPVQLKNRDRLRVIGRLSERRYSESLAFFLLRAGQIGLLSEVANADDVREVRAPRTAAYVTAFSLVQFTK